MCCKTVYYKDNFCGVTRRNRLQESKFHLVWIIWKLESRARISKRIRSPGIDFEEYRFRGIVFEESIPPVYAAWQAGAVVTAHQAGNRFLGSIKCLQIRALWSNGKKKVAKTAEKLHDAMSCLDRVKVNVLSHLFLNMLLYCKWFTNTKMFKDKTFT